MACPSTRSTGSSSSFSRRSIASASCSSRSSSSFCSFQHEPGGLDPESSRSTGSSSPRRSPRCPGPSSTSSSSCIAPPTRRQSTSFWDPWPSCWSWKRREGPWAGSCRRPRLGFIAYGWAGPAFDRIGLSLIAHRGYELDRLVGTLYMTLEGIFGVPLDVTSTYIILFTIYGAVLEQSGAGRFFIDWSMAAMGRSGSGAAPGRTVTVAGFLLGTVSGSGVATTVMLGSVAWPLLRSAGYRPETAGAILSAAGIGALISPPTLGAAAFLIAEFLKISYLKVLVMASIPTMLYYLSILLMIEADSRRHGNTRAGSRRRLGIGALPPLRLPLHVTRRDCRLHGRGLIGISSCLLGHRACRRIELPAPRERPDAAASRRAPSRAAPAGFLASAPQRQPQASSSGSSR